MWFYRCFRGLYCLQHQGSVYSDEDWQRVSTNADRRPAGWKDRHWNTNSMFLSTASIAVTDRWIYVVFHTKAISISRTCLPATPVTLQPRSRTAVPSCIKFIYKFHSPSLPNDVYRLNFITLYSAISCSKQAKNFGRYRQENLTPNLQVTECSRAFFGN
jgi:hypothetical protein